ncbi:unnamed protein product, partial [Polarella glacialis]
RPQAVHHLSTVRACARAGQQASLQEVLRAAAVQTSAAGALVSSLRAEPSELILYSSLLSAHDVPVPARLQAVLIARGVDTALLRSAANSHRLALESVTDLGQASTRGAMEVMQLAASDRDENSADCSWHDVIGGSWTEPLNEEPAALRLVARISAQLRRRYGAAPPWHVHVHETVRAG